MERRLSGQLRFPEIAKDYFLVRLHAAARIGAKTLPIASGRALLRAGHGPRNIDHDGVLIYRQSKVGKPAHVPWNSALPAFASGWAVELSQVKDALQVTSGGFTFLEANGKARSVKRLGNLIAESARTAGISKSAHGLRKSRLTAIAEAGGTAHAIMAWGGHQTLQEAERYMRAAQLKKLVMGDEHIENSVSLEIRDTKTAKT